MKRWGALTVAGLLFLGSAHPLVAQKEVTPPAIPPMLEGNRPLAHSESQHPESSPAEVSSSTPAAKAKPDKSTKKEVPAAGLKKKKGKRSTAAAAKKKTTRTVKKKGAAKSKATADRSS